MGLLSEKERWPALFRGSFFSTAINKHIQYVGFADRRAQEVITINAILVPIAFAGIQSETMQNPATVSIITALITIAAALWALYPRRYHIKDHHHANLLHFSQISQLSEEEYLERMSAATQDLPRLTEMLTTDLYHISTRILAPKFRWLKISYGVFFTGNAVSVLWILHNISS